jgi:signal transduction histidine kinase/ActR/RegA family two-component response regulator
MRGVDKVTAVLLVEDDVEFARLVRAMLGRASSPFVVEHVTRLLDALTLLRNDGIDAILVDLTLPDASGLEAVNRIQSVAPDVPLVVLTGLDDEMVAVQAVQAGAQDYLVKGQIDVRWLPRSIAYAIERQRTQADQNRHIARLAILRAVDDELTRRLDLDYVLMMGLDTAVRLSLASAGIMGVIEDDELQMLEYINFDPQVLPDTPMLKMGVIGRCLREQQAQRVIDVSSDPDYITLLPKTRAQIAIPLISQSRVVGFLSLETPEPDRFTEDVFDFAQLLAARIAAAVDNARLYQTTQHQLTEMQELYNQVRALEQMKTDIIRIATHDLRSPLNNIIHCAYLMRRTGGDSLSTNALNFIDCIEQSAARMQNITDDVLSVERLESATLLKLVLVDLQALIEKAFQENQAAARQKELCFALALSASPIYVMGEPSLLHEAVTNLIGNAIKYTPEGGTVEVRLHRNAQTATFKVMDTGYGIPEEQQARLFQPFFRARTDETAEIDGTGLGLHLVKNIITRHDGQMIFKSEYGKGSVFGFRLPLAKEEDD